MLLELNIVRKRRSYIIRIQTITRSRSYIIGVQIGSKIYLTSLEFKPILRRDGKKEKECLKKVLNIGL